MNIGLLQVSIKQKPRKAPKKIAGVIAKNYCALKGHCTEGAEIKTGDLHAVIVQGNREGKKWYKRLHLKCLPIWAEYSYNFRSKGRGGDYGGRRPLGSGPLTVLDPEQRLVRGRLIRERARLLRCFAETWEPEKCKTLWERIKVLQGKIEDTGVKIQRSLQVHRSPTTKRAIAEKVERLGL